MRSGESSSLPPSVPKIQCDAKMYHMRASIRDLRYDFSKVEEMLQSGEEILITRRKRVIARLLPPALSGKRKNRPDFLARLKELYGDRQLPETGAEMMQAERDERF